MPDNRKPPVQPPSDRVEGSLLPDEINFSIESTTMRLKSLKLRRAEAAEKALEDQTRSKTPAAPAPASGMPAGRIRHDERGVAVWDWAAAVGDTAALSATNLMRKLDVTGLSIEQTQRAVKALKIEGPDPGGGSDPYNRHRPDSGDPFKRKTAAASGDPYNRSDTKATPHRHPAPKPDERAASGKKQGGSVLDQLLGKKK